MSSPSQPDTTAPGLREQIIGLGEHSLRKSYYPQLQQQVEALRAMLAELQAMRQRAEESEANYRELFDKSGEAIIVHDPQGGQIHAVNEAFSELYGYSREEAETLSIQQLSAPAMLAAPGTMENRIDKAMACGTLRFEWLARRKDGSDFWADVTLKSASIRGERRIMATVRDITARKWAEAELAEANRQLEARVASRTHDLAQANQELATLLGHLQTTQEQLVQSEKMASLGTLVAGIAHELNTPIGNCLMVASTLQDQRILLERQMASGLRKSMLDEFLSGVGVGYDVLLRNLARASELISNFKELAVDQASSRRRRFDLREIVHEVEVAQAPSLRKAGCSFRCDIPLGLVLDSYPGPLGQVIGNLICNAITHAFNGVRGGEISFSAETLAPDRLSLVFADNGCGISAENLSRIFDPFFTTKLGQGGSGLGLHIAYNLVTGLLGGSIRVESPPGVGTRFHLELPLNAPACPVGSE